MLLNTQNFWTHYSSFCSQNWEYILGPGNSGST